MSKSLTERQRQVFNFLCNTIRAKGCPPTVREIADAFGFASPKAASDHLSALEKKGYISRSAGKSRNIKIAEKLSPRGIPILKDGDLCLPIEDIDNIEASLTLANLFAPTQNSFAFQVADNSMKNDGILRDDYVVVEPSAPVKHGDKAALRLEDQILVREVFFEAKTVKLVSKSAAYPDILVASSATEFEILGKLKGVLRARSR